MPFRKFKTDCVVFVDVLNSDLNSEDIVGDLDNSIAPPTLTGAPALRKLPAGPQASCRAAK